MCDLFEFPETLGNRARLLAAQIHGKSRLRQVREIKIEAARLHEELRYSGEPRWRAVQLEDLFKDVVSRRLAELSGLDRAHPAPLLAFAVGGRP